MISRIHVNQHVIKANAKSGAHDKVLTVKQGRTNIYSNNVRIDGPSRVVYSPDKPLSWRAKVWIETTAPVFVDDWKTAIVEEDTACAVGVS